ncbi:hypothetical protein, partial [Thiomonas sp.]
MKHPIHSAFSRIDFSCCSSFGTSSWMMLHKVLTLPPKNVSLAGCFNPSKENGNDEDDNAGALHARVQARGGAAGRGWP